MAQPPRFVSVNGYNHVIAFFLCWCVAFSAAVEFSAAANLKPSKKKSTERIDGIVAAIMALGRHMAQPTRFVSVYATRGIRTV